MYTYMPESGRSLHQAVNNTRKIAKDGGVCKLIFNDVLLYVDKNSLTDDIAEIYRLKCKCGEYEK